MYCEYVYRNYALKVKARKLINLKKGKLDAADQSPRVDFLSTLCSNEAEIDSEEKFQILFLHYLV